MLKLNPNIIAFGLYISFGNFILEEEETKEEEETWFTYWAIAKGLRFSAEFFINNFEWVNYILLTF